ncbi:hypothetical protein BDB01DRAFT_835751 [Pilobolus umbonatus]|nr:hypothetical protein BDB01DRAFT_835751 [Pilobolus umbonatus]
MSNRFAQLQEDSSQQKAGSLAEFLKIIGLVPDVKLRIENFSTNLETTFNKLLVISNKHGYFIAGTNKGDKGFIYGQTKDIRNTISHIERGETAVFDKYTTVPVEEGIVRWLSISADELRVIVCLSNNDILTYNISDIMEKRHEVLPAQKYSVDNTIIDCQANPHAFPDVLAVCTESDECHLINFSLGEKLITLSHVTAICWSPKGKQIVCGSRDGFIRTYDMKGVKKTIHPPAAMTANYGDEEVDRYVNGVLWVENNIFLVSYARPSINGRMDTYEHTFYIIDGKPSSESGQYTLLEDLNQVFTVPENTKSYFHMSVIKDYGESIKCLIIIANSASTDLGLVGKGEDGQWSKWDLEEGDCPHLPVSVDNTTDTYPVGLAIDLSSTDYLPPLDKSVSEAPVPPMPIILLMTNEGQICAFHVYNSEMALEGKMYDNMVKSVDIPAKNSSIEVELVDTNSITQGIKSESAKSKYASSPTPTKLPVPTESLSGTTAHRIGSPITTSSSPLSSPLLSKVHGYGSTNIPQPKKSISSSSSSSPFSKPGKSPSTLTKPFSPKMPFGQISFLPQPSPTSSTHSSGLDINKIEEDIKRNMKSEGEKVKHTKEEVEFLKAEFEKDDIARDDYIDVSFSEANDDEDKLCKLSFKEVKKMLKPETTKDDTPVNVPITSKEENNVVNVTCILEHDGKITSEQHPSADSKNMIQPDTNIEEDSNTTAETHTPVEADSKELPNITLEATEQREIPQKKEDEKDTFINKVEEKIPTSREMEQKSVSTGNEETVSSEQEESSSQHKDIKKKISKEHESTDTDRTQHKPLIEIEQKDLDKLQMIFEQSEDDDRGMDLPEMKMHKENTPKIDGLDQEPEEKQVSLMEEIESKELGKKDEVASDIYFKEEITLQEQPDSKKDEPITVKLSESDVSQVKPGFSYAEITMVNLNQPTEITIHKQPVSKTDNLTTIKSPECVSEGQSEPSYEEINAGEPIEANNPKADEDFEMPEKQDESMNDGVISMEDEEGQSKDNYYMTSSSAEYSDDEKSTSDEKANEEDDSVRSTESVIDELEEEELSIQLPPPRPDPIFLSRQKTQRAPPRPYQRVAINGMAKQFEDQYFDTVEALDECIASLKEVDEEVDYQMEYKLKTKDIIILEDDEHPWKLSDVKEISSMLDVLLIRKDTINREMAEYDATLDKSIEKVHDSKNYVEMLNPRNLKSKMDRHDLYENVMDCYLEEISQMENKIKSFEQSISNIQIEVSKADGSTEKSTSDRTLDMFIIKRTIRSISLQLRSQENKLRDLLMKKDQLKTHLRKLSIEQDGQSDDVDDSFQKKYIGKCAFLKTMFTETLKRNEPLRVNCEN